MQLDFRIKSAGDRWTFEMVHSWLKRKELGERVLLVRQEQLPFDFHAAMTMIEQRLKAYLKFGAEGVVLRKHSSYWLPQRCHTLLKYKPWHDDEAVVTGFTTGRATDKGSRLQGMIGALIVNYKGKRLELSGLTDAERRFTQYYMRRWAEGNPGEDVPGDEDFEGTHFSVGDMVTFKYRELADDGVPKEARYYRKRGD